MSAPFEITAKSSGAIECAGALDSYAAVKQAADALFVFAAALWPKEHETHLAEIDAEERAADKAWRSGLPKPGWTPKPGSIDEDVLRAWRDGHRDNAAIAAAIERKPIAVALSLARLRSAGLFEEPAP